MLPHPQQVGKNKNQYTKCWGGPEGPGRCPWLLETPNWKTLWQVTWQFLTKLNMQLPCDLALPILSVAPGRSVNVQPHKSLGTDVCSNFVIAQSGKAPGASLVTASTGRGASVPGSTAQRWEGTTCGCSQPPGRISETFCRGGGGGLGRGCAARAHRRRVLEETAVQ